MTLTHAEDCSDLDFDARPHFDVHRLVVFRDCDGPAMPIYLGKKIYSYCPTHECKDDEISIFVECHMFVIIFQDGIDEVFYVLCRLRASMKHEQRIYGRR